MKITDKERLDWLTKNMERCAIGRPGWVNARQFTNKELEVTTLETMDSDGAPRLRQAIDSAIRTDRKRSRY